MPRLEPWLGVVASSVVPIIVALFVHARFLTPLIAATVVLFLASLAMLLCEAPTGDQRSDTNDRP